MRSQSLASEDGLTLLLGTNVSGIFKVKPVLISTQRACLAAAGPDAPLLDTLFNPSLGTWSGEF